MVARFGSVRDRIRRMIFEDDDITSDQILANMRPKDDKKAELPSKFMVESLRTDTRQTVRLAKDLGYWKSKTRV